GCEQLPNATLTKRTKTIAMNATRESMSFIFANSLTFYRRFAIPQNRQAHFTLTLSTAVPLPEMSQCTSKLTLFISRLQVEVTRQTLRVQRFAVRSFLGGRLQVCSVGPSGMGRRQPLDGFVSSACMARAHPVRNRRECRNKKIFLNAKPGALPLASIERPKTDGQKRRKRSASLYITPARAYSP